ncbi:MAG: AraC family transcriptional regulator [Capsulimonadaceae bacterium]|nr:AraC family transcriptional regulator [Capsulimonadaceae bacterium]
MHEAHKIVHKSPSELIEFCGGGSYSAAKGEDFPPHKHSVWELVYYRSGHIRCPVGITQYAGVPGLLLITPPQTVHAEIASTAYSNYFVQLIAHFDPGWPVAVHDDPSLGLQPLFAAIARELTGNHPYRPDLLALLGAQLNLILRRARLQTTATPAEALVMRAEAIMEERFRSSLRIADVAAEIGCSPSALRAYFATCRQSTPRAYLQDVRLRNAVAFLRNSSLTVQAVADQCGFDSASHLSRCIKKATGASPGRLRIGE